MKLPPRTWLMVFSLGLFTNMNAEDGYRLWLRQAPVTAEAAERKRFSVLVTKADTATQRLARDELRAGLPGLSVRDAVDEGEAGAGTLLVGTPASLPALAELGLAKTLAALGTEGFLTRARRGHG